MTTENQEVKSEQPGDKQDTEVQKQETAEKQYTKIQQQAMEQGWVPKEEFQGDEETFIDAAEFVRRGELFGKIEHQNREMKLLRQSLEALKQHHSRTKEVEYQRALKQLKQAQKQANRDGEHEQADLLEEKIDEIEREKARFDQEVKSIPTQVPQVDPSFTSWQTNNSWYGKDQAMTAYADRVGLEFRDQVLAGAMTTDQAYNEIAKQVRKEFQHKFTNPKTNRPGAVESPARSGRSNYGGDFTPTDAERTIAKRFAATGVMTEAEYYKQLKANREA